MLIVIHALHCVNGHYFVFLSLLTVFYTGLVPVLDNHVSGEQLMSIRTLKKCHYINYMCFEAHQAI